MAAAGGRGFVLAVNSDEFVLWEGERERESVGLICESEVSIILAFRVRISRICRMPLGRDAPPAFCLVLAVWRHVIPLDLSTGGAGQSIHSLRYRSRGALFAGGGGLPLLALAPISSISAPLAFAPSLSLQSSQGAVLAW